MSERERGTFERAETVECGIDTLSDVAAFRQPIRSWRVRGRRQVVDWFHRRAVLTRQPGPYVLHGAVGDDAIQPSPEMRTRFKTSQMPVGAQKALLDDVFRILRVAGHS